MAKLVWKRQDGRFDAQTSVQKWWAKGVLTIKTRNPEFGSRTLAYRTMNRKSGDCLKINLIMAIENL